jgi:hypothetical protein
MVMKFLKSLVNRRVKNRFSVILLALITIFALILPFVPASKLSWSNIPQASADTMSSYSYRKPITLNNSGHPVFQKDTNGTLTNGLVSYYKMEGNSTDFWGTNNGTDTSITYGTSYGKINQGASFNGSSSKITTSYTGLSGMAAGTVNFWVFSSTLSTLTDKHVVAADTYNHNNYCGISNTGKAFFGMQTQGDLAGATTLPNSTWVMLTFTWGPGGHQIFVNGSLDASNSNTAAWDNNGQVMYFGAAVYSSYFPGSIDEIGIWSKALSTQEISDLYNGGTGNTMVTGTTLSNYPVLVQNPIYNETGLVGSWHMEGNATDSSGNGNNGTATAVTYGTSYGKFGQGASFNGSSSRINTGLNLPQPPITLSAWVYPTSNPNGCGTFMIASSGGYGYFLRTTSSTCASPAQQIEFDIHNSSSEYNIFWSYPSFNTWYNVVGTYDGNTQKLYINGTLVSSQSITVTPVAATGLEIGGSAQFSQYFIGYLDEVRIYNRALSSTEITNLYQAHAALNYQDVRFIDSDGTTFLNYYRPVDGKFWVTIPSIPVGMKTIYMVYGNASATDASNPANAPSGLVGDWNLDEPRVGTSYDSSGNNNNGTDTSTTVVSGKFNNAQSFNGSSSYINLGNVLGSVFVGAHSVSVWVYVKDYSSQREIIAKVNSSSTIPTPIDYAITPSGNIRMMLGNGSNYWWIDTTNTIITNQWNHIVFRYDGSGSFAGMSIYLNGVLCSVTTNSTFGTPADAANNLNIGARANGSLPMNGSLDEVRIYNRALSAAEIQGLYNYPTTTLVLSEDPVSPVTVTSVSPPIGPPAGGTPVTIGGTGFATAYRRAITVTNTGAAVNDYQVSVTNPIYNETGLLGSWHLDETSGSTSYDSSGSGINGTATGTTIVAGKFGNARQGGTTSDYINLGTTIPWISNSVGTISVWFKANDVTTYQVFYGNAHTASVGCGSRLIFGVYQGKIYGEIGYASPCNAMTWSGSTTLSIGTWYHAVFQYDGTSYNLFLNGQAEAVTPGGTAGTGTWFNATNDANQQEALLLARNYQGTTIYNPFNGILDEVRIYNRALSAAEISALYAAHAAPNYQDVRFFDSDGVTPLSYWRTSDGNFYVRVPYVPNGNKTIYIQYGSPNVTSGGENNSIVPNYTGMVGYWHMDGNSTDSSGNNNNGTGTAVTYGTAYGKFGQGASFNGSNSYVNIPNNASLNVSGGISMAAWIKTSGTNNYSGIVQKFVDSNNTGWGLSYHTGGAVRADFGNGSSYIVAASSGVNVVDNVWHFLVATYDGSTAKIYVDGVLRGSVAGSGYLTNNTRNLGIGEDSDGGGGRYFNGLIDEVRIYNRALSASEISALYTYPTSSTGSETTANPSATFGGVAATGITFNSSSSLGATTPAHALGPVTVSVMNPDGSVGSLLNGFTYGAASNFFLLFE